MTVDISANINFGGAASRPRDLAASRPRRHVTFLDNPVMEGLKIKPPKTLQDKIVKLGESKL